MKLILLKNKLKSGLAAVGKMSGDMSANLPILKNILIKTDGGRILLCSTNLEVGIQYVIPGKIIEEGAFTVDAGIISSLTSTLSTERVHLEQEDKNLLIKTDNYEARLQGLSADDFPLFPKIEKEIGSLTFTEGALLHAIRQVSSAAQYSELRPEISGVLMRASKECATFVATDSFRLAEQKLSSDQFSLKSQDEINVIIPLKAAQEIIRVADENEPISVHLDENQILFSSDTFQLISRRINGSFPEYEQIVPQSVETEITVDRSLFMDGARLASLFTGSVNEITIRTLENKKAIQISSENANIGTNSYVVPAKITGEACTTAFNWKYMLDGLRVFTSESVVFGLNGSEKPAILRSPDTDTYFYIIMPIRS